MIKDSSTECWNQVNIDEWIEKAQTNDFRIYYIMPYTLEKLGDVKDKYILDLDGTLKEIHRVLKQNGKVFISILHPCFKGKETKWMLNNENIEVLVSDYHNPKEWIGEIKGMNTPILYRHRTLSDYIKAFVKNGFILIDMNEPIPTEEHSQMSSRVAWLKKIPMYLFVELEKYKIITN